MVRSLIPSKAVLMSAILKIWGACSVTYSRTRSCLLPAERADRMDDSLCQSEYAPLA